jgi:hypothetical protein
MVIDKVRVGPLCNISTHDTFKLETTKLQTPIMHTYKGAI